MDVGHLVSIHPSREAEKRNAVGGWKWIHMPVYVVDGGESNMSLQGCAKVWKQLRLWY